MKLRFSGYLVLITITFIVTACSLTSPQSRQQYQLKKEEMPDIFWKSEPSSANVKTDTSMPSNLSLPKPQTIANLGIVLPQINPLEIKGNLLVAGSSTVYPLTLAIYQRFISDGYSGIAQIESIGSGGGFRLFCQQEKLDIINASRPIKTKELKACTKIGRKPIAFRVGTDALAIVVNPDNNFLAHVTLEQLVKIFTVEKWSDVDPKFPNEVIRRFIPDLDSGTLDFFVEQVFAGNLEKILHTPNTKYSADDEELVQGVSNNQYAIAFFGYAYYQDYQDILKLLTINQVEPNIKTIENDSYPLSRPLFIYSDAQTIQNKPQVAAFINYYLTHVHEEITKVGYFPASQQALDEAKIKLLKAMGYEEFLEN